MSICTFMNFEEKLAPVDVGVKKKVEAKNTFEYTSKTFTL